MALQTARNWSLVSFERLWKGPVFFISANANACAFCTWTNIYMVMGVWPKIRSLAPLSTPKRHVIANCVFRDVVHRIYQGVHFLIVIRLQDTRLIALPCPDFQETHTG